MIRARMSFAGFYAGDVFTATERVAASLPDTGDGTFSGITALFSTVWTPDPNSPNHKWASASPSGTLKIYIANPHAVREVIEMDLDARGPNGRKNGDRNQFDSSEFYMDLKVAPAED